MPEGKAVRRLFDDQLSRKKFFQAMQELVFGLPSDVQQEVNLKAASSDSRERQYFTGLFTQTVRALPHCGGNAAWDVQVLQRLASPGSLSIEDPPGYLQGGQRFFDEKGVAFGERVQGVQQLAPRGRRQVKDGGKHRFDITAGEARQGAFLRPAFPILLRQPVAKTRVDFVTAVGQQDQPGKGGAVAQKILQEFQAALIAPVDVLDDQQERARTG